MRLHLPSILAALAIVPVALGALAVTAWAHLARRDDDEWDDVTALAEAVGVLRCRREECFRTIGHLCDVGAFEDDFDGWLEECSSISPENDALFEAVVEFEAASQEWPR